MMIIEEAASLTGAKVGTIHKAQQRAVMRLHLFLLGRVHRMLLDYAATARKIILDLRGDDDMLNEISAWQANEQLLEAWIAEFYKPWRILSLAAQREAASIPFGTLAVYHQAMVRNNMITEQETDAEKAQFVFEPQLQEILDAVATRTTDTDQFKLSSRIWRMDQLSQQGISQILQAGVAGGVDAFKLAAAVEDFLGPNANCPRWTRSRLNATTKKEIAAGVTRGLKSGDDCMGQGVAYNALRLTRTEVQYAHHTATRTLMIGQPWIELEQVNLSPAHPVADICDDFIAAGQDGIGIYPVGEIVLPFHPHCLCYMTAITPTVAEFGNRLRAWSVDGKRDPALAAYAKMIGNDMGTDLRAGAIGKSLGTWSVGGPATLESAIEASASEVG